jgi:hypothetical protein
METTVSFTIPPCAFCSKGVEISFRQDHARLKEKLSKQELKSFLSLYEEAQDNPKATLPKLLEFSEAHPDLPVVSNLLTYVYIRLRKVGKAHNLIEETYRSHPAYLIAKINYADLLLRRKKFRQVPALFDGIFDLSQLYPEKTAFHYSEFRGFMVAMGFYHHAIRAKELALECYRLAVLTDPRHPSVLALEKKVFPRTLLQKILDAVPFRKRRI